MSSFSWSNTTHYNLKIQPTITVLHKGIDLIPFFYIFKNKEGVKWWPETRTYYGTIAPTRPWNA